MDRLTREEIEEWRHRLTAFWLAGKTIKESQEAGNALCDLALQSLSQEAVRDEALEEAARMCEESAKILRGNGLRREDDALSITAKSIRALRREPNAAAPGSCCAQPLPCGAENCTHPKLTTAPAAPNVGGCHVCSGPALKFGTGCALTNCPYRTAPDVASVVKRLNEDIAVLQSDHDLGNGYLSIPWRVSAELIEDLKQAAALLARLGQGWIPVAWIEHHKGGDNLVWERIDHPYAQATPLYKAPGASDA